MMVEKKNNEEITDFDWDKFFEEEVKDNKKIEDFAEVIKKYAKTEEKVETSKVSDDDFFDVVYKKKTEENVKENVEVDISDDEFYKILNKIKAENSDIEEKEQEVIKPLKPKYKENKEDYDVLPKVKLRQHFIRYFLYSSVLSLIIIYSLYYYVFK